MRRSYFARRWGQLIAAVVGAVLLDAITYALNPSISEANVPKFVSSLVVGAIVESQPRLQPSGAGVGRGHRDPDRAHRLTRPTM